MENFQEALALMGIGMGTVFTVLLLIIFLGKLLIAAVNKFAPEEEKPQPQPKAEPAKVSPQIAKAIEAAVQMITGGKGKVEKIEKQ